MKQVLSQAVTGHFFDVPSGSRSRLRGVSRPHEVLRGQYCVGRRTGDFTRLFNLRMNWETTCVNWKFQRRDSELRTERKVATFSSSFQQEVDVILVDQRPEWSRGDNGELLKLAEASGAATPGSVALRPLVALLQQTLI